MSFEGKRIYPGDEASPHQVLELADEYRRAAEGLRPLIRRGRRLSRAPFTLAAIHAIELYLNAYLRSHGLTSVALRALHHDLAKRTQRARTAGLCLRKKTCEHLFAVSEAREYVIMRYGPEVAGNETHLNRVQATLDEVADKVSKQLRQS